MIGIVASSWSYSLNVPREFLPRYAQGNIDAVTYDRTRIGDTMQVRYLPSPLLHQLVIIPTSRIAGISTFSLTTDYYAPLKRGIGVIIPLALLWILATKAHSNVAGTLFLFLGSLAFGYFLFPRKMPAPTGNTESTRATVSRVSTITRILEGRRRRGMTTSQPYDIVQLSFTPRGRTESVLAVDEIDHDSIPGLSPGDTLPIQYQSDQPRTVRILDGQRTFPEKARLTFFVNSGAMFLFLLLVQWIRTAIRAKARRLFDKAQASMTPQQREAPPLSSIETPIGFDWPQ